MSRRRRFTLVYVPHDAKGVREIGGPAMLMCGAVLAFLFVLGIWSIGSTYVVSIFDGGKLVRLERENDDLRARIQELNRLAETVKQQMARLTEREKAARVAVGLPDIHPDIREVGIGGTFDLDDPMAPPGSLMARTETLQEHLSRLLRETKLAMESLNAIEEKARRDQAYWRSIPTVRPVTGYLSSGFGIRTDPFTGLRRMHAGVDLAARHGEPVRATADGVVLRTGMDMDYGRYVDIDHQNGYMTRYGHLSAITTKPNARVTRGDLIGRVGNTGRTVGYHLHYEVRKDGRLLNPAVYFFPEKMVVD